MSTVYQLSPLEWIRDKARLNKRQMAVILQMTEQAYGRLEKGGFKIAIDKMQLVSAHFGVSMDIFNPESTSDKWESMFDKPIGPQKKVSVLKNDNTIQHPEEPEDLFLKDLEINTLQNQIKGLEEAMQILKKKYLDLCKENAELKKLKNHPNG